MRMQNGNEQKHEKLTQPVNRAASTTVDNDNIISPVFQRQFRRFLQMKRVLKMLLYMFYFA